jgi:hypothetical protein
MNTHHSPKIVPVPDDIEEIGDDYEEHEWEKEMERINGIEPEPAEPSYGVPLTAPVPASRIVFTLVGSFRRPVLDP